MAKFTLAIEIPTSFARDVKRGKPVQIAAWVDGANPQRAETVQGYVQGMHRGWLLQQSGDATRKQFFDRGVIN